MRRGPRQQVVDERANPSDRPTLRPARKDKLGAFGGRLTHEPFKIAHRCRRRETRLVQIDLVAVFDRAQELDAVERTYIQVRLEVRMRAYISVGARAAKPRNHL